MNLFKKSIAITIIVRIYFSLLNLISIKLIPFKPSFPYSDLLNKLAPRWLSTWGNFDGVHYINISNNNYYNQFSQVFFPFYPLLMKLFNTLTNNPIVSGITISTLAFIGFIYFFIKLGQIDFKPKTVNYSLISVLIFPTSFFLLGVYTESLFLFFATASIYLTRKRKYWLASALIGLATATRLVGIFLIPMLLWEYYLHHRNSLKALLKTISLSIIGLSGFLGYLSFLNFRYGDALMFIHSQSSFGTGREVTKIIMLYQVFYRYLKMILTVNWQSSLYPVIWLELMVTILFLILIIYAFIKKLRLSYLLYIIPTFLLPTLTGTFSSMPRYVLACFPLFYLIPNLKSKTQKILLVVFLLLLQAWAFTRFASGQWVA